MVPRFRSLASRQAFEGAMKGFLMGSDQMSLPEIAEMEYLFKIHLVNGHEWLARGYFVRVDLLDIIVTPRAPIRPSQV